MLACSYNCRQLTYGSFQLAHMSRDDTLFDWSSHGGQNKDKTSVQCSQHCHKGEFQHVNISAQQWYNVDRIFMGLSWELHCHNKTEGGIVHTSNSLVSVVPSESPTCSINRASSATVTVFVRSDTAATVYFITQFSVVSIWEWLLFESGTY